jgi:hypothetical protein
VSRERGTEIASGGWVSAFSARLNLPYEVALTVPGVPRVPNSSGLGRGVVGDRPLPGRAGRNYADLTP